MKGKTTFVILFSDDFHLNRQISRRQKSTSLTKGNTNSNSNIFNTKISTSTSLTQHNKGDININIFNTKGNSNSNSNQVSSFVLDHLLFSSPSSSQPFAAPLGTSVDSARSLDSMLMEFDPSALIRYGSRGKILEGELDSESEEGVDFLVEAVKPTTSRSSGSKRSRAAEVHNLSEKRRRSRINEKMKALQSLIPNSNKTDKASMLDEAIEYLKQLQLQVQMLSMRNGLNLSPTFLPVELSALQVPEMRLGYGVDSGTTMMNMGMGVVPLGQDPLAHDSLCLPNQCSSSIPRVSNAKDPVAMFVTDPSPAQQVHAQHGSFNLSATSEDVYMKTMAMQSQLGSSQVARTEPPTRLLAATIPNSQPLISVANHERSQATVQKFTI